METLATLTQGETEAAAAGAILGGAIGFMAVLAFAFWILTIIASWKVLEKAGEPGWKAIIPIYNIYMMYKIVGMAGWFWGIIIAGIVLSIVMGIDGTANTFSMSSEELANFNWGAHIPSVICLFAYTIFAIVADVYYCIRTSKAFNHGGGFAVGLFFLQPIFWLILGFGKSKYNKKVALK